MDQKHSSCTDVEWASTKLKQVTNYAANLQTYTGGATYQACAKRNIVIAICRPSQQELVHWHLHVFSIYTWQSSLPPPSLTFRASFSLNVFLSPGYGPCGWVGSQPCLLHFHAPPCPIKGVVKKGTIKGLRLNKKQG